jgi:hypothetical protein
MKTISKVEGEAITLSATVPVYRRIKPKFNDLIVECATQVLYTLSPKLKRFVVYTAAGGYVNYTNLVTDADSTTHAPLDGLLAASGIVYIGCDEPFRGLYLTVADNVNANAATLDVEYWNGAAWADVAGDADGTTAAGATLAQSGIYTWNLPTNVRTAIDDSGSNVDAFWIRFKPSANLSAAVDLVSIIPIYQNTNRGYFQVEKDYLVGLDAGKCEGIELLSSAGGPTCYLTWLAH